MIDQVPLLYHSTAQRYFERIRPLGGAILLDSCGQDRFDILVAAPQCQLVYQHGQLTTSNLPFPLSASTPPFTALQQLYHYARQQTGEQASALPFTGGLVGHCSYDLGRALEPLANLADADTELADLQMGLYNWAIIIDHQHQQACWVANRLFDPRQRSALLARINGTGTDKGADNETKPGASDRFRLTGPIQAHISAKQYQQAFTTIQNHLRAGDCYQVNFAQRFSAPCSGDPWRAYQQLREQAPTPFAAYFDTPHGAVLSFSPERFLQVDSQQRVLTKPIKGTRPRGQTPAEDELLAQALQQSTKDRAENVMIVDLLRNDLSKVCLPHSVQVPALFQVEHYRNVHHLVSSVTGQLDPAFTPVDLLRHCFPGGSITGAPKIRAMQIIETLEPKRRAIYCGSIGYLSTCGKMDSNIAIRTLLVDQQHIHCWGGGGIVADSDWQQEYQESLDKINNLLAGLTQLS